MKVQLKTGFWQITDGELTLEADILRLRTAETEIFSIPLRELRSFSLYRLRRFRLETEKSVWEGFFLSQADSSSLLQQLCGRSRELQILFHE